MIVRSVGSHIADITFNSPEHGNIAHYFLITEDSNISIDTIKVNGQDTSEIQQGENVISIYFTISSDEDVASGLVRIIVIDDNDDEYVIDHVLLYIPATQTIMDLVYNLFFYSSRFENGYEITIMHNGKKVYIPNDDTEKLYILIDAEKYTRLSNGSIFIFTSSLPEKIKIYTVYKDLKIEKLTIYSNFN